jgi:hypothetical protein
MKRTWLIFAAALLVLLSYPLTYSHAGQLNASKPSIVTPPTGGDIPDTRSGDSGGDDGDADDIGSLKLRGDTNPGAGKLVTDSEFRIIFLRGWWSLLVLLR